jgi:hypothetical protein
VITWKLRAYGPDSLLQEFSEETQKSPVDVEQVEEPQAQVAWFSEDPSETAQDWTLEHLFDRMPVQETLASSE